MPPRPAAFLLTIVTLGCASPRPAADPRAVDDPAYAALEPSPLPSAEIASDTPPEVRWEQDVARAYQHARRTERVTVVFVCATWSVSSVRMEAEVFGDPAVRRALESVVALRIDVSGGGPEGDAALVALGVEAVPTVLVLAPNRRERGRIGAEATAADLLALLQAP